MKPERAKRFTIRSMGTVEDALKKFEENNHGTVIVVDDESRVVGTLTDGDVRKALIDRRMLLIPVHDVMNTDYICIAEGQEIRAEALFKEHFYLRVLPLVDSHGVLKEIILRDELRV